MFLLTFALRNLDRHRRRTMITASALALGLAAFVTIDSMLQGADAQSEQNILWYEFGGARVATPQAADEFDKISLKSPLNDPGAVVRTIQSQGFRSTPRLVFQAELTVEGGTEGSSRVVRAVGADAVTDSQVFPRRDIKMDGRWFQPGEGAVVLGAWLSQDLNAPVGSVIDLTTRTREGSFQVITLTVVGVALSPDPLFNRSGVFLPLDQAANQLGMDGQATEVDVAFQPGSDADKQVRQLQPSLDRLGVRILSWKTLAGDFLAVASSKTKGTGVILLLVLIIAAVGVGNTMLLAFYERKTEIGMLRALGMDDRQLLAAFLLEAAGIGVIGSALGLAVGAAAVGALVGWGLDFSSLVRTTDIGYRVAGTFHGVWEPGSFAAAAVVGIVLAVVCAVGPTRRALRLPIIESLRSE